MDIHEILADLKSDSKKKVILDTDAANEVDDQYVIAYCCLCENIELLSVNAAHFAHTPNDTRENCMIRSYEEIKRVLSLCDPQYKTPVFKGCTDSYDNAGLPLESEAVDNIINTARNADGIVYILAIGTITNIVCAIMKAPDVKEKICVVWLALSQFDMPHPVEHNLDQDYKAGQYLLDCKVPCVIVPAWDVTSKLIFDIENIRELKNCNPAAHYLWNITEKMCREMCDPGNMACTIWDLGAIAAVSMPECCKFDIVKTPILTQERKYAFDPDRHEMIMVNGVDRDPIYEKTWKVLKRG